MIAIIPSYYNFTKEENNKLRKIKHGFRLEKMKKDYKLEDFGLLAGKLGKCADLRHKNVRTAWQNILHSTKIKKTPCCHGRSLELQASEILAFIGGLGGTFFKYAPTTSVFDPVKYQREVIVN